MKRSLVFLVPLLPIIGIGVTTIRGHISHGPVYSLAALQIALTKDPEAWVNRTLVVRGVAAVSVCVVPGTGALCGIPRFSLRDPNPAVAFNRLDLTWAGSDPLLTFLRRVPLIGTIMPAPQVIQWGVVADYRVQLQLERSYGSACCEALLLDAAP